MTSWLIDALLDELVLRDKATVEDLLGYRNDKAVEESAGAEIARGQASKRRRERGHWDRVSALMIAVAGARTFSSQPHRVVELPAGQNPIHAGVYTFKGQTRKWKEMRRRGRPGERMVRY